MHTAVFCRRGSLPQLGAGEVVGEDLRSRLPLLGQRSGSPLAHPDPVAVASGGEEKAAVLILHREAGAPQAQRLPQRRAGHGLAADGQGGHVAGGSEGGLPEPALRCGEVGREAQLGQKLLQLCGRERDGVDVVVGVLVGAAVHRDEIGDGGAPDVLAGFGLPIGDGEIAGPGGGILIVEYLRQDRIHQSREPGVVGLIGRAPIAAENGVGQIALPPGRVGGEPACGGVLCVVPAVEGVAVGRDGLGFQRLVRPGDGHFRRHGPDEVVPAGHRHDRAIALVGNEEGLAVPVGGRQRGGIGRFRFRGRGGRRRCRRPQHGFGQPVSGQRQQTAQHEQHGTEQKKGTFHSSPSRTGSFVWASVAGTRGEKAQISSSS